MEHSQVGGGKIVLDLAAVAVAHVLLVEALESADAVDARLEPRVSAGVDR
jgi:hypothetical protein